MSTRLFLQCAFRSATCVQSIQKKMFGYAEMRVLSMYRVCVHAGLRTRVHTAIWCDGMLVILAYVIADVQGAPECAVRACVHAYMRAHVFVWLGA